MCPDGSLVREHVATLLISLLNYKQILLSNRVFKTFTCNYGIEGRELFTRHMRIKIPHLRFDYKISITIFHEKQLILINQKSMEYLRLLAPHMRKWPRLLS